MHAFANKSVIVEKVVLQLIGTIINNAIDWDGHRNKRLKIQDNNENKENNQNNENKENNANNENN